jgi:hypothetical protein
MNFKIKEMNQTQALHKANKSHRHTRVDIERIDCEMVGSERTVCVERVHWSQLLIQKGAEQMHQNLQQMRTIKCLRKPKQ